MGMNMRLKTENTKIKAKGPHIAEVIGNYKLSSDIYRLVFKNGIIAETAKPGQFVSVLCEDLVLRRPFSIAKTDGETVEIIYKIKGKGTKYLSMLKIGDTVDVIGALGKGFNIENKNSLLIGCGVGYAPINFLSAVMAKLGIKHTVLGCFQTNLCQSGARQSIEITDKIFWIASSQAPRNDNATPIIITEDGSAGLKGRLDNHLENIINQVKPEKIYTCGPNKAMEYIVNTSQKHQIPIEVALERDFACGTGVCMGCVIQIKENDTLVNKRICKDGPVFDGYEVVW